MKRLKKIQRDYLSNLLEFVHDYQEWDSLNVGEIIALRLMNNGEDDEGLQNLVNRFIKQWRKANPEKWGQQ